MTKAGKIVNNVTGAAVKAGGVVTKHGGEAIGEIGKTLGMSKEKCNQIKQSTDRIGKDLYYASGSAGQKAQQVTEDIEDATKRAYQSVKETVKDKF